MSADRTDAVIEAIDGALEDWDVSGDAMRWVPEETRAAVIDDDGPWGLPATGSLPEGWADIGYMAEDPLAALALSRFASRVEEPMRWNPAADLSEFYAQMRVVLDRSIWSGTMPIYTILDETHFWCAGRETTRSVEEVRARAALAGGRLDELEWVEPTPESLAETERVLRILHSTDQECEHGDAEGERGDAAPAPGRGRAPLPQWYDPVSGCIFFGG